MTSTNTTSVTVADFVSLNNVSVEILRDLGMQVDREGWEHHAYRLRLVNGSNGQSIDTDWGQGTGVETSPTETPVDVLASHVMDAQGWQNTPSFDDWCAEYGYDTDGRRAYAMWETIRETINPLDLFLGTSELWQIDTSDW